jgi:hypothetical protein
MAVKPITNQRLVNKENINRAEQVSTKDTSIRGGNDKKSIVPGLNYGNNYAITLKDVDTAINNHMKDVMRLKVSSAGEQKDVPIMYANQERWVNARKNNFMKDKSGAIVLPLVLFRRTGLEKNTNMYVGLEHDVHRKFSKVVRNSQWSKDNKYDRFAVQTGKKPVTENIVTGVPDYVIINYDFIVWTNFIEQMNTILEAFVEQDNIYWGGSTNYRFLSKVESISDSTEMSVDTERFIKSTFNVTTYAYLLPEYASNILTNKVSQTSREITPAKIVFGFEGDATDKEVNK